MRYLNLLLSATVITVACAFSSGSQLTIASNGFRPNSMISAKFSCQGAGTSPNLTVKDIPSGAKSLALIVQDPDAPTPGGFTHWVAWNLSTDGIIHEGEQGGDQGLNGAGKKGYIGMCPPSGTHHYHFMVYALDTKLELPASTDKAALEHAMEGHILAQGDLVGLFEKMPE